jgi:hypothetical protein
MKQVPAAYLRFQPQVDSDSLIPDNRHAIQLIDSATAVAYGGAGVSPWTRVNDSMMNPSNRVYTVPDPPTWRPEAQESQDVVRTLLYLHELADKALLPGAAERRDFRLAAPLQVAPRPCRGLLQVGLPPGAGARELRVHDACGRLVARAVVPAGNPQAVLDLRDLQPGVYFASVAGAGTVPVVIVR